MVKKKQWQFQQTRNYCGMEQDKHIQVLCTMVNKVSTSIILPMECGDLQYTLLLTLHTVAQVTAILWPMNLARIKYFWDQLH